jgi:NAD(P)H-quinone oxidoreductase subunit 5
MTPTLSAAAPPFGGMPAAAVPAAFALGAIAAAACRSIPAACWRLAEAAAVAALAAAGATAAHAVVVGSPTTLPQATLLAFVAFLGLVLVRYSRSYLAGERNEGGFAGWLLATLAGATTVLAAGDLLTLSLAWVATSLALQQLLTFHRRRPLALVAAREKFLVSRCADFCMLTATALLGMRAGTLDLAELAAAGARGGLGDEGRVAIGFVAVAALLKCAQMPFHGWLLRVMEAPTPVSALLHAGVVNLGGFVLLRLAPLVEAAPFAQWLLVGVGGLTAAIAALAASAQPSVKAALAWSTCSQMGFLMVQCGLGLFEMALLHLVAHSAYKAHAFLSAAGAVQRSAADALLPPRSTPGVGARLLAAGGGVALVAVAALAAGEGLLASPALAVGAAILALGLAPLLVPGPGNPPRALAVRAFVASALAVAWFGLHGGLRAAMGLDAAPPATWALAAAAAIAMAPLPIVRLLLAARPGSPLVADLHALCQRGLFLDEWFTRFALRTWRHSPFVGDAAFVPDLASAPRARGAR